MSPRALGDFRWRRSGPVEGRAAKLGLGEGGGERSWGFGEEGRGGGGV